MLSIENNPEPMLALAAALHRQGRHTRGSAFLAKEALKRDPNYVLPLHQAEQLWGEQIRKATADF